MGTDIKQTKHPKPHPDRKFKAKSIETPAVYCRHEGPCTLENCECLQAAQYCSKFCGCFVPKVPPRPRAVRRPPAAVARRGRERVVAPLPPPAGL